MSLEISAGLLQVSSETTGPMSPEISAGLLQVSSETTGPMSLEISAGLLQVSSGLDRSLLAYSRSLLACSRSLQVSADWIQVSTAFCRPLLCLLRLICSNTTIFLLMFLSQKMIYVIRSFIYTYPGNPMVDQ